jgi:TldD protein
MITEIKEKIKNLSADYGEIHVEVVTSSKIIYSNNQIEAISTSKTISGNARVLINGGWGFSSFNEMDLDKNIAHALDNARLVGDRKEEKKSLIFLYSSPIIDTVKTTYQISPDSISLKQKNELAKSYSDALKHPQIASTKVTYKDWKVEKYFVNTEGSCVDQHKVFTGISYGAMAKDGGNVQQAFESVGQYGGLELVLGLEAKIEKTKKRALDLLSAKKVESGQYQVLLDTNLAGVFIHEAFGHMSEADFLYENPRMQEVMLLGRQFGPEFLNVVDDGSQEGLAGFTPYDDEGVRGAKNYLIKNGKLHSRLHSRETAFKMNEKPTGNARATGPAHQPIVRMTNTYIENSNKSFEELLSSIEDGIYAIDYLGGMTNLEMFTFSAGYAYEIKKGKICGLLRDVVLSGNVFNTLHNIVGVGNDIKHHGGLGGCGKGGQGGLPVSTGSPHVVIQNVLVGGV